MLSVDCKEERKTGADGLKKEKEGRDRPMTDRAGGQNYDGQRVGGAMIGEGWGVLHEGWLSGHTGSHGPPP